MKINNYSRYLVLFLVLFALSFALVACERPLNEDDSVLSGAVDEEAADEVAPESGSPIIVPTLEIVPPTPETLQPEGELVDETSVVDEVNTDAQVDESNLEESGNPTEDVSQPESEEPPVAPAAELVHIVQAGDNLYRIGLQYGCTIEELAIYNEMANPDYIDVGDEIRIPPDCGG